MPEIPESREAREQLPPPSEWFSVATHDWHWKVSREMAAHVERVLDTWPRPKWVVFVDLAGSRVKLRTALIEWVEQSTPDQRHVRRKVYAALKAEDEEEDKFD